MSDNSQLIERFCSTNTTQILKRSRVIDPLAYSLEFEKALGPSITLLQASLDYVSSQLKSLQQRRILTRLEHKTLARALLSYERGKAFNLSSEERIKVATSFIMMSIRKVLEMVVIGSGETQSSKHRLEVILKRLGAPYNALTNYREFLAWDNAQNLSDLLNVSHASSITLQPGNESRKLHYICQLSVYTSTPKQADDYPVSVLLSPEEYFSINTIWSRKPELWSRNALVTPSGKLIFAKCDIDSSLQFRRDLGPVADLHLVLARLISVSLARPLK